MIRRFPRGRRFLAACVGFLAWLASGTAAQVQEWKVLLRMGPSPQDFPAEAIRLRPNARQPFYFFVQKPEGSDLDSVLVQLTAVDEKGTAVKTLAETTVPLPHADPVPVHFGGPKAEAKAAEGAKAAEAGKPAPAPEPSFAPLPPLPVRVGIEVRNPKAKPSDKPLTSPTFAVTVLRPVQYVEIGPLGYEIKARPEDNRFFIGVKSKQEFAGPPCPVELVLQREYIPGLVPAKKSGNLRQTIPGPGKTVELVAENLAFEKKPPERGTVGVTVDGYPRAFLYTTDFTRSDTTTTPQFVGAKEPTVRILDPRKTTVPVEKVSLQIEIDSPLDPNLSIEVGVDRNLNDQYEDRELQTLRGERQQLVSLAPAGPDGAVLLKAEVRDWQVDLDTAGVRGRLPYRVRILGMDGNPVAIRDQGGNPIPAEQGIRNTLIFDDTPPEDLTFPDEKAFPRELQRGERRRVEAFGTDPESDIARVQFFVGKPAQNKDGKPELPANIETFKATKVDGKRPAWSARVAMPDKVGREFISVQFVNGAGLSAFETMEVKLTDPAAVAQGAEPAKKYKITGKVVEGDRPQAGLVVTLTDDKGMAKATATTAKDDKTKGNFTFENVAPGIYVLSTSKVASDTKGEAKVTVEVSDVKDVVLNLYR